MTEDQRRELAAAILAETIDFLADRYDLSVESIVLELAKPKSKARRQFMELVDVAAQTVCEF